MDKDDRPQRHLTPAPVSLSKLATIGDVFDGVSDHENTCAARRRKLAMWAITTSVAAAGVIVTLGIFLAKFLIVGAITLELDRRFPAHMRPMAADHSAVPSLITSAHAETSK